MDKKQKNPNTATQPRTVAHEFITCRRVLNIMVFLGFMVNYMLRVNLTFAIVDMVAKYTNVTETSPILTEVIVLNRSARSIPEEFKNTFVYPVDDDDEKSNYNRNFRKKNFIGDPSKKAVSNLSSTSLNKTFTNIPKSNSSFPNGFQSFTGGASSKTNGLQSYTGTGGKTQFSSGTGGFQPSGVSSQFSNSGGFQSSGGSSQYSNSAGFQSSAGGSQLSGSASLQSSDAKQSSIQNIKTSEDGVSQAGFKLGNEFQTNGLGDNESGQSSNASNPNGVVGSSGVVLNEDDDTTLVQPLESKKEDSSSIDDENTGNIRILTTNESDKPLLQAADSKLEAEAVAGDAVIGFNNTQDSDLLKYTVKRDRIRRFNWSEAQQGILIGSFFWGYICTELPGGRLAEIVGARRVFGYATLGASVVTLLTPLSAKIHFIMAVIIRILLGLFLGVTWPSILPLASKWIPPDERGKFLSNMMGSTLGAGFTLPLCGLIISSFSWEYVFYITGLLGFIWSVVWFILVFETPADHPRISAEERWYIETKLGLRPSKDTLEYSVEEKQVSQGLIINQSGDESCLSDNEQKHDECNRNYSTFAQNGNANGAADNRNQDVQDKKSPTFNPDSDSESAKKTTPLTNKNSLSVSNGKINQTAAQEQSSHANAPWFHILTSVPVWAFVLTHGASVFGYNTITNQLPTYMNYILHYNIKQNGVLSSLPYIGKYVAALIGGSIADRLLRSSRFSKNFVRKLFTCIAVMVPGFLMLLQIFVGSHKVVSIFVFTAALTFNGCVTGGYLGNSLDIAPDYSGTVFGLGNMFSGLSGAVSAILVGYLTDHNQVYGQWQKVFLIVAVTYIVGALIFIIFGSTEVQSWNSPTKNHKKKNEVKKTNNNELQSLETYNNVS